MDSFINKTVQTVLSAFDNGIIPWRRPWRADANCGPHTNILTGRRFSGVNQLVLELAARKLGLATQWWGTPDQWRRLGGAIKPVSAAGWNTESVLYQADGSYTTDRVFNFDEAESEFPDLRPGQPLTPDFDAAEALIRNTGARFEYKLGRRAIYYRLDEATGKGDYIEFPLKEQFVYGPVDSKVTTTQRSTSFCTGASPGSAGLGTRPPASYEPRWGRASWPRRWGCRPSRAARPFIRMWT